MNETTIFSLAGYERPFGARGDSPASASFAAPPANAASEE